ncbi:hypothetical protein TIFTF001_045816 [Ficus carica]|uniref:Uncharacterized protein n=1 Tax=Ficus carica TaxID=3494 RepID=A0AA87Z9K5_FICCA|nr:hypothetical protein TIFTF001_045816 [Ficus carica]
MSYRGVSPSSVSQSISSGGGPLIVDALRRAGSPELQALYLFRDGLPLGVKQFIPAPIMGISLEDMIDAIMEAKIISYMVQVAAQEDDYLLVPIDDAGIPEPLDDPPIIIIANDDDEEDVEEEVEKEWEEFEGMKEEIKDVEDDPEEILFGDDDWDVFSDVTTE